LALPPKLGIIGAEGRLGGCLCRLAAERGGTVSLHGRRQGWELHAVPDVVIDVSHPSALTDVIAYCRRISVPLVEGVSGLGIEDHVALRQLSEEVAVVVAANFSFGHFLQRALLVHLASLIRRQPDEGEFTILERHPSYKKDRPSATARELSRLWSTQTGRSVADVASIRAGLPVADHEFALTFPEESLLVRHAVTDRQAAARGALRAASWVSGRPPGLWTMNDVYEDDGL
jgi:4-hydroxy-tetrahydrodipicolinate reductase